MKRWLDTYFGFRRKEANGLLVLIGLIGLIMLIPYSYSLLKQHEPITEIEEAAVLKLALAEKERVSVAGVSNGDLNIRSNPGISCLLSIRTQLVLQSG